MEQIIGSYFRDLFQTCSPSQTDLSSVLEGVCPKLSSVMSCFVDSAFTSEEVKKAIFEMGATKAPGKDGLPALFYQHFWDKVGSSVILACLVC
ncbi:hypothetical protein Dsin_012704 [Dipteronia sinensis]|uniref:Reverse transcriptase n=1 Tax=Dipteronia sinensis TaxID=43782 RepID=A0AAE0AJS1_9ROSI|nr:hypothetical protein Dsin_012704 [Dipteronia sinensis]